MNGGKSKLALVWTNSHKVKQGIYVKPQALTRSEAGSLKADLKHSLASLNNLIKADSELIEA